MHEARAEGNPPHVLLVEDEAMIRLMVAEQLKDAGLAVTEAGNADEAQAYFDAGNAVDLLFTDVRMPGTMDGLDLARYVRSRYPMVPIVITSGFTSKTQADGIGLFLPKPFNFDVAMRMVLRALGLQ